MKGIAPFKKTVQGIALLGGIGAKRGQQGKMSGNKRMEIFELS